MTRTWPSKASVAGGLVLGTLLLTPTLEGQQTGTITGRVVDAGTQGPLASVQVFVVDSQVGTLTRPDGSYQLSNVPSGAIILRVQRIGYQTEDRPLTVTAGQSQVVNFSLRSQALALDAIVVTGTPGGTQRRAIGNVVAQVEAAEITERAQITSVQDLISGRVTGVEFTRRSGNVGAGSSVRIRGVSSINLGTQPLIYIDGVRMQNSADMGPTLRSGRQGSALDDINPDDIESIEVIKGPAAATLYGTEASAGVIQIITKKGQSGAPVFNASMSQGITFLPNPSELIGDQYGRDPQTGNLVQWGDYRNIVDYEKNVYGNDIFTNGHNQTYDLSAAGGLDRARYFVSASWENVEGVVDYNWNKRLNLRANLSLPLAESLSLDVSSGFTSGLTSYAQQIEQGGIWGMTMWAQANTRDTDRRGFLRYTPEEIASISATRDYQRFTGSANFQHSFRNWLTQRLVLGLDRATEINQVLVPRHPLGSGGPFGGLSEGQVTHERPTNVEATFDYGLSAALPINNSIESKTSVGLQYYSRSFDRVETFGTVFAAPSIRSIQGATNKNVGQTQIQNKSMGVYFQQEVAINNRVFLTGAVRADDNSAFGSEFDAAIYPKFSATWVISEEPFWTVPFVNSLRLRSAWGQSGRQPDTFAAVTLFAPTVGKGGQAAVLPDVLGNPDVGPEVGTELELGFDYALLDDRISGEFTYFNQKVTDALTNVPLTPTFGFPGTQAANLGQLNNWGWEAQLDARIVEGERWGFTLGFLGSHTMNEIVDLGGLPETNTFRVGAPYPIIASARLISGEFDANGRPTNLICDGGKGTPKMPGGPAVPCNDIRSERPLILGTTFPPYTWGINASLRVGQNLEFFTLAEGEYGRFASSTDVYCRHTLCYSNSAASLLRDDPLYVQTAVLRTFPTDATLVNVYDADFWKLRELGARYRVPANIAASFGASQASVSIAASNLWTIWVAQKDISGVRIPDPESTPNPTNSSGGLGMLPGTASVTALMRVSF